MLTSDFDYHLPKELVAQKSIEPRDHSRLMVINREEKIIEEKKFFDIAEYFRPGDLLVWNNSKVFKARLYGSLQSLNSQELWEHKRDIELFLVRPMQNVGVWKVLAKPGRHVRFGMRIHIADDFICEVIVKQADGTILVQFSDDIEVVRQKANKYGSIPVPPYVEHDGHDLDTYQTVYAKQEGSVAAPTAGFHFTDDVIRLLKNKGIEFQEITLHVGLGTFLPVKSDTLDQHVMHGEWVELSDETAKEINRAKKEGRRVVAVGTTTVRTLEGVAAMSRLETPELTAYCGDISIFIHPGFHFEIVDALITNFHLPKSTLLMLVSAFVGDREFTLSCYKKAVEEKYRFYSFGDAMFIV